MMPRFGASTNSPGPGSASTESASRPLRRSCSLWRQAFELPDGTPAGMIGLLDDITDRKQAEAEECSRLLLDAVRDGIVGVDTEGRVIVMNPAGLQLLDDSADELMGQSSAIRDKPRFPARPATRRHLP